MTYSSLFRKISSKYLNLELTYDVYVDNPNKKWSKPQQQPYYKV